MMLSKEVIANRTELCAKCGRRYHQVTKAVCAEEVYKCAEEAYARASEARERAAETYELAWKTWNAQE